MNDKREITEYERDVIFARAFGREPPPDPAKSTMSLDEAQDVSMGAVFNRPNLTPALVSEAKSVIAYHAQRAVEEVAAVESGDGMSEAQRARLAHARLRVIGVALSKGLTGAPAVAFGDAVMRQVQETAMAEGRSFDEVIAAVDAEASTLRLKPGRPTLPAPVVPAQKAPPSLGFPGWGFPRW
jgi:hypothetical protein